MYTEISKRNISLGVKVVGAEDWQPNDLHVWIFWTSGSLRLEPVQTCDVVALLHI